jgi:hypothetical protein
MIWWNMQNKIQGSPCSLYLELDDIQWKSKEAAYELFRQWFVSSILRSSTIMNNILKWLVMTMRLHALPLLMRVDFTYLRLHCPWWSLQPPLRSLFGLSDSSRPHGSRSALTKNWFKPHYFVLVEWNKSHSDILTTVMLM